jgi:peroxiredoxin
MRLLCIVFYLILVFPGLSQTLTASKEPTSVTPLLIGQKVPSVILSNVKGLPVNLQELLIEKPSVIIFYRGGWCPYCNTHLAELQTIEKEITKSGFQILAISPDSPESLRNSLAKKNLRYTLLSDSQGEAMRAFGIAFLAPERYADILGTASDGQNTLWLPVPSVFVTGKDGSIIFQYVNPDYKVRLNGNMLMAVLRELKV